MKLEVLGFVNFLKLAAIKSVNGCKTHCELTGWVIMVLQAAMAGLKLSKMGFMTGWVNHNTASNGTDESCVTGHQVMTPIC